MRQSQNLYKYLYQMLTSQLLKGVFLQGQKFLSQRELCLQYNVGITTVRKVMKMLDEQGYIRTAQGQPSIVTYHASKEEYAAFQVQRRDEIADAYHGLELIMPVLYREGAKRCDEVKLRLFWNIQNNITEQMDCQELYRQANIFFTALISTLDNRLALDLELDSENYLLLPYLPFPGVNNPFSLTAVRLRIWLKDAIELIEQKQFDAFCEKVARNYQITSKKVDDYLCALSKYTDAKHQEKQDVCWFRIKGHSELYVRLAMNIVHRIVRGEFDETKYLPSIPKLMEEYGVMKDTASRAVTLLNSLGFVRTIDKKGSIIIAGETNLPKSSCNLSKPVIRERLSLFLEALQIVAITAGSCASSFSSIPKHLVLSMENMLCTASKNRISPISFQLMTNTFIQIMPYYSLKNIFQQLEDLLIWGHYLQTVDESFYPNNSEMALAMKGVIEAVKKQDSHNFPYVFDKAFTQVYRDVCEMIAQIPIDFLCNHKKIWKKQSVD